MGFILPGKAITTMATATTIHTTAAAGVIEILLIILVCAFQPN